MMRRIAELERRLDDLLLAPRPPCRIAVARWRRGGGGGGRGRRSTGLSVCRRGKRGATPNPRRSGQHRAPRDRMPANRLLSHGVSSKLFWFEPAWRAADRTPLYRSGAKKR